MHLSEHNTATPSGFSSFVAGAKSDWHSGFVKSPPGLECSQELLVMRVCDSVRRAVAIALSVENVPKVSHFPTLVSIHDGGRRPPWSQRSPKKNMGEKFDRRGEELLQKVPS